MCDIGRRIRVPEASDAATGVSMRRVKAPWVAMIAVTMVAVGLTAAAPSMGSTQGAADAVGHTALPHQNVEDDEMRANIEARSLLGFPADHAKVVELSGTSADVGSDKYGIPMTTAELAEWERRGEVQVMAREQLVPAAQKRSDFAGFFMDHQRGGKLVVLTTGDPTRVKEDLTAVEPRLIDDLVVRQVDVTDTQLDAAAKELFINADQYLGGIRVHEVAVDVAEARLVATVPAEAVDAAQEELPAVTQALGGIEIAVQGGDAAIEQVCFHRENCHHPMRAGIVIRRSSPDGPRCTMGFHIVMRSNNDRQALTSGHCDYNRWSLWYHRGYVSASGSHAVGYKRGSLYENDAIDMMRVSIPDSQASNKLYKANPVTYSTAPYVGMNICADLGRSDKVDCGTVRDASVWYLGGTCNCVLHGAKGGGYNTQGGDSGSPIRWQAHNAAVGIHSTNTLLFAPVRWAMGEWGSDIYSP